MRLMTFPTALTALCLAAVLTAAVPAQAQDAQALSQRLERLERDIQTLSKMVVRGPGAVPAADLPAAAKSAEPMPNLPQNAVVGSSSLRRQALIRRLRPDLKVITFRGQVETRLRKLDEGLADATLLAHAGLKRLGNTRVITELLDPEAFPPAPGQGAICIEARMDDRRIADLLAPIDHADTHRALLCERAFLAALDGSCRTPIAGLATITGSRISFFGMILTPDGAVSHEVRMEGPVNDAAALGAAAGAEARAMAGPGFFESWS